MMEPLSPSAGTRGSPDLSSCATEPIHIPGAIQPHGCLLVVGADDVVLQASENAQPFLGLGSSPLGEPAQDVLGAAWAEVEAVVHSTAGFEASVGDRSMWFTVHRDGPVRLVEIEHAGHAEDAKKLESALPLLTAAREQEELLQLAAETVRALTGFDRVLVYRFDEDHHGMVVTEIREPEMQPYLGLHFPESDIPSQARALYLRNWIRFIPDVGYAPVAMQPMLRPDTRRPLDMSEVSLRSVSPVHIQYLRNMGVGASLSISLVAQGRLWGLVSCGHRTPKAVPSRVRAACESLGRLVSLQIGAFETTALQRQMAAASGAMSALRAALATNQGEVLVRLLAEPDALLALTAASGAAVVQGTSVHSCGKCPADADVLRIAAHVARQENDGVFATRQLCLLDPEWTRLAGIASGVLAMSIPGRQRTLLWFRPELVQTVDWGGDPNKSAQVTRDTSGSEVLHPRRSFALWQGEVRTRSLAWGAAEKQLAAELRQCVVEHDLHRQLELQNAALKAREDLVAVVSHDLRTPVSIIAMQATLLQRLAGEEGGAGAGGGERSRRLVASVQTIQRSADRMTNLLRDLLDLSKIVAGRFEIAPTPQSADLLVADACELMQHVAVAKGLDIVRASAPSSRVSADPERIFQVFSNLIGNALKFTPAGNSVTVGAVQLADGCEFFVSDTGSGMEAEELEHVFDRYWQGRAENPSPHGAGLGLYICRGIVEAHGGRIRVESVPGRGTVFHFTLPLADGEVPAAAD